MPSPPPHCPPAACVNPRRPASGSRVWGARWKALAPTVVLMLGMVAGPVVADTVPPQGRVARGSAAPPPALCAELTRGDVPQLPAARRALLLLLEQHVAQCSEDARYLALLGGLWLEQGNPGQALLWLERALLLEPGLPGAQADHALALYELGEPEALRQLRGEWVARTDLPDTLRQRLQMPARAAALRGPAGPGLDMRALALAAASPRVSPPRWRHAAELSLMLGHETNLDRSPTLDNLTLTPPDSAPIDLPLLEPLRPKAGSAWMPELGWRSAWDSGAGALVQVSGLLMARRAPSHHETDWYYAQLALEAWKQLGAWRWQAQAHAGQSGGPLNEPYQVRRLGMATETDRGPCTLRLALDQERRHQQLSHYADADVRLVSMGLLCAAPGHPDARWGLTARVGTDQATDPSRPGGDQRLSGLHLRFSRPLGSWQMEVSLRLQHTRDDEGYSPLLNNNELRRSRQWTGLVELVRPIPQTLAPGWQALGVLQWQASRQASNIVVFEHQSDAVFGGLRLRW